LGRNCVFLRKMPMDPRCRQGDRQGVSFTFKRWNLPVTKTKNGVYVESAEGAAPSVDDFIGSRQKEASRPWGRGGSTRHILHLNLQITRSTRHEPRTAHLVKHRPLREEAVAKRSPTRNHDNFLKPKESLSVHTQNEAMTPKKTLKEDYFYN